MKVKMVRPKTERRPPELVARLPEGQTFITLGKEYEVHAMSLFKGQLNVQIIDDLRRINWYPAWFFETFDSSVPSDWICNLFNSELSMVIGPKFLAESIESCSSMVQLDDDLVQKFWRRLDERERKEPVN